MSSSSSHQRGAAAATTAAATTTTSSIKNHPASPPQDVTDDPSLHRLWKSEIDHCFLSKFDLEINGNQSNRNSWVEPLDGTEDISHHPQNQPYASSSWSSSSSSSSLADLRVYRAATQRLLQYERGSFTPETYFEAEQILSWWSVQRTVESVQQSLALLQRTSQEEEEDADADDESDNKDKDNSDQATKNEFGSTTSTNHNTHHFMWESWLTPELLNAILKNWRHVWVPEYQKRMQHVLQEETQPTNEISPKDGNATAANADGDFVSRYSPPALLEMVNQLYESTDNRQPRLLLSAAIDEESFLRMAQACQSIQRMTNTTKNPPWDVPRFCEQVLHRCLHLWLENGVEKCQPSARFFNTVLHAWAIHSKQQQQQKQKKSSLLSKNRKSSAETDSSAARRADAVWQLMRRLQIAPDRHTYLRLMQVHAATQSVAGAQRCQDLLQQMYHEWMDARNHKPSEYDDDDVTNSSLTHLLTLPPPHSSVVGIAIDAWAASRSPQAGEKALEILRQVQEWRLPDDCTSSINHGTNSGPYMPVIHAAMKCFASLQTLKGAQMVEELFVSIKRHRSRELSYQSFLITIKSWAQVGQAERAESLLQEMIQLFKKDATLKPDTTIWNTVIAAFANSKVPDKVERTLALLRQMEQVASNVKDADLYLPNKATFDAILNCCAKSTSPAAHAKMAQDLIQEMKTRKNCRPTAVSYATVIRLWAKAGHPRRAEQVFHEMLTKYMETKHEADKPDMKCFNAVLAAFVRSKQPDAALDCLKRLDDLQKQGLNELQPTVYNYATVIAAFSSSPKNRKEKAQQAEQLLRDMQEAYRQGNQRLRPDVVVYNSVMNAWARAGEPTRAEQLLVEMYDDYAVSGNAAAQPDVTSFNTVLKAWGFAHQPDQMEAVLTRMKKLASHTDNDGHGGGLPSVAPDVISYTTLIMCYGFVNKPDKAQCVLEDMKQQFAHGQLSEGPNRKTYEMLHKAWMISGAPDKLERAEAVRREMMEKFGHGDSGR